MSNESNTALAVKFSGREVEIIEAEGQRWVRGYAVCEALGYKHPDKAMSDLYKNHEDEFSPQMTRLMRLPTDGGMQDVRVFNLRGAHLMAMFSRTDVAKSFRRWLLDLIEQEKEAPVNAVAAVRQEEIRQNGMLRDVMGAMAEAHGHFSADALQWIFSHARDDLNTSVNALGSDKRSNSVLVEGKGHGTKDNAQ